MAQARIEHVNITVSDIDRTAAMLMELFEWRIRWRGPSAMGGATIHVGTDSDYLAIYMEQGGPGAPKGFSKSRPLNHVGVLVDDLDETERRVKALGLKPFSHGDYEPGRRFYFFDLDGIEYEVVSYG
jgi:catechol 2,3-dioxygenase-like lactoylglutathione lyase family enzyme